MNDGISLFVCLRVRVGDRVGECMMSSCVALSRICAEGGRVQVVERSGRSGRSYIEIGR